MGAKLNWLKYDIRQTQIDRLLSYCYMFCSFISYTVF